MVAQQAIVHAVNWSPYVAMRSRRLRPASTSAAAPLHVQVPCSDPADRLCPYLDYVVPANELEVRSQYHVRWLWCVQLSSSFACVPGCGLHVHGVQACARGGLGLDPAQQRWGCQLLAVSGLFLP